MPPWPPCHWNPVGPCLPPLPPMPPSPILVPCRTPIPCAMPLSYRHAATHAVAQLAHAATYPRSISLPGHPPSPLNGAPCAPRAPLPFPLASPFSLALTSSYFLFCHYQPELMPPPLVPPLKPLWHPHLCHRLRKPAFQPGRTSSPPDCRRSPSAAASRIAPPLFPSPSTTFLRLTVKTVSPSFTTLPSTHCCPHRRPSPRHSPASQPGHHFDAKSEPPLPSCPCGSPVMSTWQLAYANAWLSHCATSKVHRGP